MLLLKMSNEWCGQRPKFVYDPQVDPLDERNLWKQRNIQAEMVPVGHAERLRKG